MRHHLLEELANTLNIFEVIAVPVLEEAWALESVDSQELMLEPLQRIRTKILQQGVKDGLVYQSYVQNYCSFAVEI